MKKIVLLIAGIFLIAACATTIDTKIKQGNEGFVIGNGSIGVLLTHGLAASPYEVRQLADYLAARNMTVYGVRLDGHGTSPEDLSRTTAAQWYTTYHNAYLSLKSQKQKVFVGGMSLGGALALKLAEDENVSGIIALAPALELDDSRSNYAWLFKYFTKYSSRNISSSLLPYYYPVFPVASVAEMVSFGKITEQGLGKITEPIFIMQYAHDYRVSPRSSQITYDSVASKDKTLQWLDGSNHVMILNAPNETQYFEEIYRFIIAHAQ